MGNQQGQAHTSPFRARLERKRLGRVHAKSRWLSWMAASASVLLLWNASCSDDAPSASGCASDSECKGDRLCIAGRCVDPGAGSGGEAGDGGSSAGGGEGGDAGEGGSERGGSGGDGGEGGAGVAGEGAMGGAANCAPVGDACAVNGNCCGFTSGADAEAVCLNDGGGARCLATCTNHDQCLSECCGALEGMTAYGVCAPASVCQSPPNVEAFGTACSASGACGQGLVCVLQDSVALGSGGPPQGVCTVDCSQDSGLCAALPGALCLQFTDTRAYCVESCSFGDGQAPPDGLDPNKCKGRPDFGCGPVIGQTDIACQNDLNCGNNGLCVDNLCVAVLPVCLPQCAEDTLDCPGGYCNRGTGLCQSAPPVGLPLGAACTPEADQCAGVCQNFRGPNDDLVGSCSEGCVFGVLPACGWDGAGPAPAACLFFSGLNAAPGVGDLGSCAKLCDCDDECENDAFICSEFTGDAASLESLYGRRGLCVLPATPDAVGLACADPG